MKIAAKVCLSHFLLGLSALALGVTGFVSVGRVTTQYERALRQTLPVVDALNDARFQAEHIVALAYRQQPGAGGTPRAGDAAQVEAGALNAAFGALEREIRRHRRLVETYFPEERMVAEALSRAGTRVRDAATALAHSPVGTADAITAREALHGAIDALRDATADALAEEELELSQYQAKIDDLRTLLQWTVLACTLAAFVVALLVGSFAARRLARPIVALRDVAKRFALRDLSVRATPHGADEVGELAGAFNDMAQALGETMVSRAYVENILAHVSDGVLVLDEAGRIRRANPAAAAMLGWVEADLRDRPARDVLAEAAGDGDPVPWPGPGNPVDVVLHHPGADPAHLHVALAELIEDERPAGAVLTLHDTTARRRAEREMHRRMRELEDINERLSAAQGQLLQSEKMAAIGQLSAGVAHEINNPIGFISANLGALARDIGDLIDVIRAYERLESQLSADNPELVAVRARKAAAEVDFLIDDLPKLIAESREGTERVRGIVDDLRAFSRADEGMWQWANLEACLDSTLNIVWHEIKYKAELVKDYQGIPEVRCLPSQLSQVFMNLLVNAGQAIAEHGTITLRTGAAGSDAWLSIEDTGCGIRPENLKRIFDPFFTTKPVGQGTGLGLSLAYGIVERHRGRIEVSSEPGKGTTFRITLPIDAANVEGCSAKAA